MLNKVMVLTLRSAPHRLIILEEMRVQFLGQIPFLTGKRSTGIPAEEVWLKDVPVWYPMSEIVQMAEFETFEDLKRAEAVQRMVLDRHEKAGLTPEITPQLVLSEDDLSKITTPEARETLARNGRAK